MSADRPFVLRGGNTEQAATINRINAIERIKYLTGVDMRNKSLGFLMAFDMEMYKRWYAALPPDTKIDEEWCQRAATVVREMEGLEPPVNIQEFNEAVLEHQNKLAEVQKDADKHDTGSEQNAGGQTQRSEDPVRESST